MVFQSHNLMVSQSYNLVMFQSHNLVVLQFGIASNVIILSCFHHNHAYIISHNNFFLFLSYIDLVQLINSSLLQCLKYNNSDPHIRLVLATWERKIVNKLNWYHKKSKNGQRNRKGLYQIHELDNFLIHSFTYFLLCT